MNIADFLDRPIAFQRAFVSFGAGITGALMLSQALYWSKRTDDEDGWFYKTMEDWEAETGMTRSEQESARKRLVKAGVLEEKRQGVPCRLFYRVSYSAIAEGLDAENQQSSLQDSRTPVCRNPANKDAENPQASLQETSEQVCGKPADITENTTEITTEITSEISCAELRPAPAKGASKSEAEQHRQAACREIWAAYSEAYEGRYGIQPVRNAKVNTQVNDLLKRLGAEAAAVAAYYVLINDAYLIRNCHDFGSLLTKAEAYRTQWATNRQVNGTTARQLEQTQANINAAQQAAENIRGRKGGKPNAFL